MSNIITSYKLYESQSLAKEKYLVTVETNSPGTTNRFIFTGTEPEVESFAKERSRENCLYYKSIAIRDVDTIIVEDDVIEQNAIEIQKQEIENNSIYTIEVYNDSLHSKWFT